MKKVPYGGLHFNRLNGLRALNEDFPSSLVAPIWELNFCKSILVWMFRSEFQVIDGVRHIVVILTWNEIKINYLPPLFKEIECITTFSGSKRIIVKKQQSLIFKKLQWNWHR